MVGKMIRNMLLFAVLLLSVEVHAADYTYRSGYGLEFSWLTDDRVGVTTGNTSSRDTEQLSFWISSKASASRTERQLYAVGYQLKPETTYYSYSPYKWSEEFDARAIECRFDKQTQNGNGSTSGLASCDYQMAVATTSSTACAFSYRHIGGVLRISFKAPEAMAVASLNISTQSPKLATIAVMDIIGQKVALDAYASRINLVTERITVNKGEEVVAYIALPAQDLFSTSLSMSVKDENNNEIPIATVVGPNIKAGYLYDMNLSGQSPANTPESFLPAMASVPAKVTGIANPTAHAEDFLIDTDYKCEVVSSISPVHINNIKDNNYYTLQGMKTTTPVKGQVYIHKGKKVIR